METANTKTLKKDGGLGQVQQHTLESCNLTVNMHKHQVSKGHGGTQQCGRAVRMGQTRQGQEGGSRRKCGFTLLCFNLETCSTFEANGVKKINCYITPTLQNRTCTTESNIRMKILLIVCFVMSRCPFSL